ncbi:aminodeoxychorismate/anthranilate synthase component II [Caballeronia sp. dw_276]|uniref:anthranilate synthase component II n=1 Tax=Caballeronia sp. dw_276 TaxID=2719795 RepID=UPI001BD42E95|nr:aminodeoxychorismate/anthranilate synthase component II [Caballeronia sp. dw_276]
MNIVLIDNYDSFTYNLHDLLFRVGGKTPQVVCNDATTFDALDEQPIDAFVLSPGPGHPAHARDFGICADVIKRTRVPVLGICLGHQGLALSFGGSISRAPMPAHGIVDHVSHDNDGLFAGVPQRAAVVRYHSLIVDSPLPLELRRTAWTDDGLIMGIQHVSRPLAGVQFHPESICSTFGETIISNFLELAQRWNSVVSLDA